MALLPILYYPDPKLRTKAKPVTEVTDALRTLIDDMFDTMYDAPGIGLAASQVDVHKRIIVIDVSETRDKPNVYINPELELVGTVMEAEEGCLSVPGYYELVERVDRIKVTALDRNGDSFTQEASGLLAVCIQHESDHLDGKLFVDYLSALKRTRIKRKLVKLQRQKS
jgi:peptide deformylase